MPGVSKRLSTGFSVSVRVSLTGGVHYLRAACMNRANNTGTTGVLTQYLGEHWLIQADGVDVTADEYILRAGWAGTPMYNRANCFATTGS
jgi:hypothetical protein